MLYTKLTTEAMKIAYEAHHGQVDKGGLPYILHPIHLAEQMEDEYSTCVALLHDVVEDTNVTLEDLKKIFPQPVIEAVALMTHAKEEPYLEYVARVKTNPIAKAVKLADIAHNSDQSRIPDMTPELRTYFQEKYRVAYELLTK